MEVLGAVVGAILAEPCKIVFGAVYGCIKNFFKRESNFSSLKNEMNSLKELRDDVKQKLDQNFQLNNWKRARVEDWLRQVGELEAKIDGLVSAITASGGNRLKCSCTICPTLCQFSSELAWKIKKLRGLKNSGELVEEMMSSSDEVSISEHIPGPSIMGQKTASENLEKLLDLLKIESVARIGVWGMGGVGKTTLAKNLNNEIGNRALGQAFKVVVWVTVSRETNLRRIQLQIAERLNMGESGERMAIQLHKRLMKEGDFLLILDDVWEAIDLDLIGIPRQEICARSKIIITSRSRDVCREMMTQSEFEVKVQNEEESWELFRAHAGQVADDERIKPIAEMVAKECDGLPLALIVVGASMRGKSLVPLWNDALRALQMSVPLVRGMEEKVYKTLKWSYDALPSKTAKFCFLFCCLYPEDCDIKVSELVRYFHCEELLDERLDYEKLENQGIAIIQSLIDCCLLECGLFPSTVKMHDVVRDVGIWIACSVENECKSLVRARVGLSRVAEDELLCSYKRISFMNNRIDCLPSRSVQCPEASTLLLQGNWDLGMVPDLFIQGFEALKILDLSKTSIRSLPSLLHLSRLRALLLRDCRYLTELPPLDGLSRLVVLDCSNSGRKIAKLEAIRHVRHIVADNPV